MTPASPVVRDMALKEHISQEKREAREAPSAPSAPSAPNAPSAPLAQESTASPGWLLRAIRDEDVLLFLLGVRWISLLPPALALLAGEARHSGAFAPIVFGAAILCNLALSLWHPRVDRALTRHPWLLGVDLAIVAAFLALTGGADSPYDLYAYTPLLAAAFFFGMRGALAALALTAFYLLALAALPLAAPFSLAEVLSQILAFFLIAFMFGYPSVLLQRLKAANDELQRAQEDVQRATTLAALGKTVAHVSHEIRNPLVTLGGFARRIMRSPDDGETVRQHAQIIVEETARLENLLTNVLTVARPPKLKLSRGNVHEVLDQACLLAGGVNAGQQGRVAIEKDYDPSLPWISMNAPALLRALMNVIRNAVQALPEGGTVQIATRYDGEHEVAQITITDSGSGISEDILHSLFEPFVTARENGTGLGLAITHQIVHEHGGTIRAGNAPDGGAQFTICLPLAPRE